MEQNSNNLLFMILWLGWVDPFSFSWVTGQVGLRWPCSRCQLFGANHTTRPDSQGEKSDSTPDGESIAAPHRRELGMRRHSSLWPWSSVPMRSKGERGGGPPKHIMELSCLYRVQIFKAHLRVTSEAQRQDASQGTRLALLLSLLPPEMWGLTLGARRLITESTQKFFFNSRITNQKKKTKQETNFKKYKDLLIWKLELSWKVWDLSLGDL